MRFNPFRRASGGRITGPAPTDSIPVRLSGPEVWVKRSTLDTFGEAALRQHIVGNDAVIRVLEEDE